MTKPKVYIVVLNYNSWKETVECIESLFKLEYQNVEIVLVDNNSADGTPDIVAQRFGDRVQIIRNARKSYFVADQTKFKMTAPVRIASLADLDGFFTDLMPPKSVVQLCADHDVFVRTVETSGRAR